eukprot:725415-Hanusia_phi.AAC.2
MRTRTIRGAIPDPEDEEVNHGDGEEGNEAGEQDRENGQQRSLHRLERRPQHSDVVHELQAPEPAECQVHPQQRPPGLQEEEDGLKAREVPVGNRREHKLLRGHELDGQQTVRHARSCQPKHHPAPHPPHPPLPQQVPPADAEDDVELP